MPSRGSSKHNNAVEDEPANPRPPKISRIDVADSQTTSPVTEHDGHASSKAPRTRGVTACQTCRTRKTKCDNQRPACSYCTRVSAPCVYLEEDMPAACNVYGAQILDAVKQLTNLVQSQQQHREAGILTTPRDLSAAHSASCIQSPATKTTCSGKYGVTYQDSNITSKTRDYLAQKDPPAPLGLESTMNWSIFSDVLFPDLFPDDDQPELEPTHQLPTISHAELSRLTLKYTTGVHVYNPILDLSHLHHLIGGIVENGLDWSTETCLVMLVCAIGATTEGHYLEKDDVLEDESELAWKYWSVASKRIGFAIGQSTIQAIQCLCLVGIWYMHNVQPLQAWKYFSLAGNAWYATTRRKTASANQQDVRGNSATLEQSLYFTIYKSECELRIDLNIPGSVLADVNLPYAFPLPPYLDRERPVNDSSMTERGWYYYLAEIAARHQINNLLRSRSNMELRSTAQDIKRLFSDARLFETQLMEWHASLPPPVSFEIPQDRLAPHADELIQILRLRYLTICELLYKPFVQLCVEYRLDIDPELRSSVAEMATRCLQCCLFKLESVAYNRPQRHHGTWFGMGTIATCIMVLAAVNRAHRDSRLLGAAEVSMPDGWVEVATRTVPLWNRFWHGGKGGALKIKQVVDWALADINGQADGSVMI